MNTTAAVAAGTSALDQPKFVGVLPGHTEGIPDVRFSGDGALIATASRDQTVRVWDAVTGREVHTLTGHSGFVLGLAFH